MDVEDSRQMAERLGPRGQREEQDAQER